MNCLRPRRNPKAFTLAELLIVIAIIGVLIAILLPALSAARRSANSVKCLASLKEIGQAFQMYAQENHRYFPVVRWRPPAGAIPASDPSTQTPKERVWMDFIVRYLHKRDFNNDYNQYKTLQNSSALWGCPAYNVEQFNSLGTDDARYSLSYGMNPWPIGPYSSIAGITGGSSTTILGGAQSATNRANVAYIDEQPVAPSVAWYGQFFTMEKWGKHAAEKALLCDSNGFEAWPSRSLWTSSAGNANLTNLKMQPLQFGLSYPIAQPGSNDYVFADASRHIAPTTDKKKALKSKGINVLFVDGHAAPATPTEYWKAAWMGGVSDK